VRHRNERRMLRKQVGDLAGNATRVRDELFACEAHLVDANRVAVLSGEVRASSDSLRVDVLRGIEEYVDALAKLVDVDDRMTSFAFQDDESFHDLLVSHRWRGAETVEQAKAVLEDEVAHRSVGKSDLALLLSSVDRTAFLLYGKMPETFKSLHGEALVGEIAESLRGEEFSKTLMQDTRWSEMRRRWVRLGWRGTSEENFNDAFIRAAAERVVEIHDGDSIQDTILDERIQKERSPVRDQMLEAFRVRLEREYDALPRRYGEGSEVDVTFDRKEVKQLDALADRWDTSRSGAMERIVREAVDAQRLVVGLKSDDPDLVSDGDWWNDSIPYSDHELMRRGRLLWEASYAQDMTDEDVRTNVVRSDAGFPAELVHFSAKWAVHAFQRLMTSHTFAAALMCSDVQREVIVGIEKQWDAFLVIVPNGMLVADRFEFTRVMVATYSFGARMLLVTSDPLSKNRRSPVGLVDEAPTLADLLVSEESDLVAESQAARCFVLAKRLVAGLLLNLQHPPNFKIKQVEARPKSKKREAEPEHRIVTIGQPIEIDCRDSVKEYIEHGKSGRKHGPPTVQVMVRGHYRRQVCGVGRMERKTIWIQPFWRGPEAALIQTRASKVTP